MLRALIWERNIPNLRLGTACLLACFASFTRCLALLTLPRVLCFLRFLCFLCFLCLLRLLYFLCFLCLLCLLGFASFASFAFCRLYENNSIVFIHEIAFRTISTGAFINAKGMAHNKPEIKYSKGCDRVPLNQ